jgi:AcrR family transcriptional regulator
MARKYALKRRAEKQEETSRRIARAVMELHETIGPAATTVSAVAARAGVQRLTVYRHFPDEHALVRGCADEFRACYPIPAPATWMAIADPAERLATAIAAYHAYYARVERMLANVARDAPRSLALQEVAVEPTRRRLAQVRDGLAAGWGPSEPAQRRAFTAAIGHAVAFGTWQSLVREQGLTPAAALALTLAFARCATALAADTHTQSRLTSPSGEGALR